MEGLILGQEEVSVFLKQHKGKWFSTKRLSEALGVSRGSIGNSAKKLRSSKMVNFKLVSNTDVLCRQHKEYKYSYLTETQAEFLRSLKTKPGKLRKKEKTKVVVEGKKWKRAMGKREILLDLEVNRNI
jgi:hypothetical protein